MYSVNQSHHSGGSRLLQRYLCSYRALVSVLIMFLFMVFLYYYNESLTMLKSKELEGHQCQQKLDSVSAQLQVVYEHKTRLEKSLAADREACGKKTEEISEKLKTAMDEEQKTQAQSKDLEKKLGQMQQEVESLKAARKEAEISAANNLDDMVRKTKDSYTVELQNLKSENLNLSAQVAKLQRDLSMSHDQLALQQRQQPSQAGTDVGQVQQASVADQLPINEQQLPRAKAVQPPAVLVPPNANELTPPPAGSRPHSPNAAPPSPVASEAVHQQRHQVAVPIAERQQQELFAQQQVPVQQQQQVGAPAPVLQHPLGEDQQQLMLMRKNSAVDIPAVVVSTTAQAPPAVAPAGNVPVHGNGGGEYREIERDVHGQNPADAYKDDEEENKQREIDPDG